MSEKSSQDWIKIILLGESGVGKTNLINAITGKDFDLNTRSSLTSSYTQGVIYYGIQQDKKIIVLLIKFLLKIQKLLFLFILLIIMIHLRN